MALNDNRNKINNNVARDLAKKNALEKKLDINLNNFFDRVAEDLESNYVATGELAGAARERELVNILSDHYDETNGEFKRDIRRRLARAQLLDSQKLFDNRIDEVLDFKKAKQLEREVRLINGTNVKEMDNSIRKVQERAAIDGRTLTRAETARQAREEFRNRARARSATIANTETQITAEQAKKTEANILQENDTELNNGQRMSEMKKMWNSVLDEKTRMSHVFADGQERKNNEPFVVENEKLMTPGDTSLGASAKNVINCRCSSIYVLD
jgi:hypothetical protein